MSINLEWTYPKELEKAKKERWPVILPVGVMEYHSTHCPYGCDALVAVGIAREVAKKVDCVVMPPIWYGFASYAVGGRKSGTVHVPERAFEDYVYYVFKRCGVFYEIKCYKCKTRWGQSRRYFQ